MSETREFVQGVPVFPDAPPAFYPHDEGRGEPNGIGVGPCPACGRPACEWWRPDNDWDPCIGFPSGWDNPYVGGKTAQAPLRVFVASSVFCRLERRAWWSPIGWIARVGVQIDYPREEEGGWGDAEVEGFCIPFGPFAALGEAVAFLETVDRIPLRQLALALSPLYPKMKRVECPQEREVLLAFLQSAPHDPRDLSFDFEAAALRVVHRFGDPKVGLTVADDGIRIVLGPFKSEKELAGAIEGLGDHAPDDVKNRCSRFEDYYD